MGDIRWNILQPVDVGAQVQQGFATGMALVKQVQANNALRAFAANPDDPNAYSALAAFDPQTAASMQQQHLLRRKALIEQQERERRTALGELYTQDPAGAREEAVAAGDFDLAEQFGKLDEAQQKRSADFWGKAGALAFKLKQSPTSEARTALWQQARPLLEQMGAPAEMLDRIDPLNDTQLDAAIATSQKIGDLIAQSQPKEFNVGPGEGRYARDPITGEIRTVIAPNPGGHSFGAPVPVAPPAAAGAVASTLSSAMPDHVVAGFLGNFEAEGGYGGAKGDGGTAAGIAQWRGERLANFERVIGKPVAQATPDEQARFVLWEMQNPEAAGMSVEQRDAILNARSAGEAAELIDRFYERSSGEHRQRRIDAANRYAGSRGASPDAIRAAAKRAIDAGADPEAVRARARSQGVEL